MVWLWRGIAPAQGQQVHLASPDVLVDEDNQRLVMYFHGMGASRYQLSRLAVSGDGLNFEPAGSTIPSAYLRSFSHGDWHYLLAMPGVLYRSKSRTGPFEPRDRLLFDPTMRHAGLWLNQSTLHVAWSQAGDAPERPLLSIVDLQAADWDTWQATQAVDVLRPERE